MKTIKVALLGLGTVGTGVYETIHSHQLKLRESLGLPVQIVGILVKNKEKPRKIENKILVTTDVEELLKLTELDIVFEAIVGIEPANSYIQRFLEKGCHVISANKELLAHKGKELSEFAKSQDRFLVFEAAVAGGVPLIRTIIQLLQINGIVKLEAILNGTSNYILTKMRKDHSSFQHVLHEAQRLGYAEADPSNDILGTDAFYKLMILSQLIYQEQPHWEDVEKVGIQNIVPEDLLVGEKLGLRLKLIASLTTSHNKVRAEVKPVFVDQEHPLYNVEGVDNGIVINTDLVGSILLQGPGAGAKATASSMIEDLVYIRQYRNREEVRPRFSYNGEVEAEDHDSVWLSLLNTSTSEAFHQHLLFQNNDIRHIRREVVKTDEGYVVGDLLIGKREEVWRELSKIEQESLRFYQVSGESIQKLEEQKQPIFQTTTL